MLGLKWILGFIDIGDSLLKGAMGGFGKRWIDEMKIAAALSTIHEDNYETKEVQDIVTSLKADWSNSPETASEFAESFMSVMKGQLAKLQLQNMVDVTIDSQTPVTDAMFKQIGIITDITLLASTMSVIGEILSIGQIDTLGEEIRSYLDYAGLTQITGFGYGMLLSNAVTPLVTQEIGKQVRSSLVDPQTAVDMNRRGIYADSEYWENMARLGFSDKLMDQIKAQAEYYPNPVDFIRFAVRDVYNEEIVTKWKYDSDFPVQMEEHIKKAGMSLETLRLYWRAHWELPSPNMGYEMLHRGELNIEELEELLRISDYAPGYIEKMINISYTPFTRVDARRMHAAGVLDDDQFIKAYTDIGYNQEMAEQMLEWVKSDNMGSEKALTRTMIIQAYVIGLIDRSDALEYIEGLGYDTEESDLILSLEDSKEEQKHIEEQLKVLRFKYARDMVGVTELESVMTGLGLSVSKVNQEIVKAELEREKRARLPTKADLKIWLNKALISESEYRGRMSTLGYQDADISLYIMEGVE